MGTVQNLSKVVLKTASVSEHIVQGQKTIQAIIPTSEFVSAVIPNKANSRDYTGEKNKSVEQMIKTLHREPEMFRIKNLGIRMVASDYTKNGDELVLYFDEDEGIFNGGHTYTVLKSHGRKEAFVTVNIDLDIPKEKLAEISLALNMSKRLEAISQGEKIGAFDWVKKVLPNEPIVYKEGDAGSFMIDDVLKVANILKVGKGRSFSEPSIAQSIRSKATIIRENNEKQVLTYTRFLLPDVWNLYKDIRNSSVIIQNIPKNYTKQDFVLQGLAICFLAGVRYMMEVNKNDIPMWKSEYNKDKALALCEKLSKQVGRELKKAPYKDMKAEAVYRDNNFQMLMRLLFADALNKE